MRRLRNIIPSILCTTLLAATAAGCNAYRLKTPAGFAEVDSGDYGAHYKGSENVGLRINTFDNVKGGTLAFWSEDLVRKLAARGYSLQAQTPTKSQNGLPGTRFDFSYDPPGGEKATPRSYAVVLFVSDKHIVVEQLAGTPEATARYHTQLQEIAASTKVRGCRAWTDICESPQPAALTSPASNDAAQAKTSPKTSPEANPENPQTDPTPKHELASEGAPQGG